MKIYIANDTCSRAVQLVANELGIPHELIHFDVFNKTTSTGEDFAAVNPLLYVPALQTDDNDIITEAIVIISYLADLHLKRALIPEHGTRARVKMDQLLVFITSEIAQKHIPLMRKLMTEEGVKFNSSKLLSAYKFLDDQLEGRPYLFGGKFTVADAYVWGTLWNSRSGVDIRHLKNLEAWKVRVDARPAAIKTIKDEAEILAIHRTRI